MFAYTTVFNQPQPIVGNPRIVSGTGTNVAQTYTNVGATVQPTLTTTRTPKFGVTSLNLSTTASSWIRTTSPTTTFTNVGLNDFAFETWIYFAALPAASQNLYFTNVTRGLGFRIGQTEGNANINSFSIIGLNNANLDYAPFTWAISTWYYVCAQRSSGVISFYIGNGNTTVGTYIAPIAGAGGSASTYNFANATAAGGVYIGSTTAAPRCLVNEIQVTRGSPRYSNTGNITLPTGFLPVDQFTTQEQRFQGPPATTGGTNFVNTTS